MGFFSGFQNKSAVIHLHGTLTEFVMPSIAEARSRGLADEVKDSLITALRGSTVAVARASGKGQLSIAETMLGKMLMIRKSDMITAATHSLVGIYIASAKRSELYPEFIAEFEAIHDRAGQMIPTFGGGGAVSAMWELNKIIGR